MALIAPSNGDIALGTSITSDVTSGLASYVGPGTFQALVSTSTDETATSSIGYISPDTFTEASPSLTITYTFDNELAGASNVPEPASVSLLGFGFALTVLRSIHRRRTTH